MASMRLSRLLPDFGAVMADCARMPLVVPALALFLGIIAGEHHGSLMAAGIAGTTGVAGMIALLVLHIMGLRQRAQPQHRVHAVNYTLRHAWWLPLMLLSFACGNLLLRIDGDKSALSYFDTGSRCASGIVDEVSHTTLGDRAVVRIDSYVEPDGQRFSFPAFKVLVCASALPAGIGDRIILPAAFDSVATSSPIAEFDYRAYLYSRGIDLTADISDGKIVCAGHEPALRHRALLMRDRLVTAIESTTLHPDSKRLIAAILLGDRTMLSADLRSDFAGAGIAHVLAVSGLHVGIIAMLIAWLLLPVDLLFGRRIRLSLTIVGIMGFAALTGFSPSATRAAIMSCGVVIALLTQRRHSAVNLLALAAIIMLCAYPRAAFDIGFQLSFAATWCVLMLCPLVTIRIKRPWLRRIVAAVSVPIIVFLVTWPLTASYFHEVSLMFLPANLLLVPLLPLFFISAIFFLLLGAWGINLAWLGAGIDMFCRALAGSAHYISEQTPAHRCIFLPEWTSALLLLMLVCGVYALYRSSRPAAALCCLCGVGAALVLCVSESAMPPDAMEIRPGGYGLNILERRQGIVTQHKKEAGTNALLRCAGQNIVWLDCNTGRDSIAEPPMPCDLLIVGANYRHDAAAIFRRFRPAEVLLYTPFGYRPAALADSCTHRGIRLIEITSADGERSHSQALP